MCMTKKELENKINELRSLRALQQETADELKAIEVEIIDYMKENNLDVIDETPLSYPGTTQFINNRPIEIKLWLNDHPEIKKWVSIEDDLLYEHYEKECGRQFANHLVTTLFYGNTDNEGLTEDAVNKAIKILK